MADSMPDMPTLLGAAVKYLEEELLPALDGYHRFQTRVTINVLKLVRRELDLRATQSDAESSRLSEILGHGGGVRALNDELCESIRSGAIGLNDEKLRSHLRQSLADALAINNPKWMTR